MGTRVLHRAAILAVPARPCRALFGLKCAGRGGSLRWSNQRSVADCVAALEAAGVPCSAYGEPGDALDDPHLAARGLFSRVSDAAGSFVGVNPPWRMSRASAELGERGPAVGADGDAVLGDWLALGPAEIDALRAAGAFGAST